MDVHRCRFVDYQPSAINALAFTYSSGSAAGNQPVRLAIGRANGDIEIWNPHRGEWVHEITLRGGRGRTVEGLAWIQNPDEEDDTGYVAYGRARLFSIGYSNTVTEWDLFTGLPLRNSSGTHSEVWCLAAQPKDGKGKERGRQTQDLVVGCADGSLVLFSTADDEISFRRRIGRSSKKSARALSVAFQDRNTLLAGFSDNMIRVYNMEKGTLLRTMSLGQGAKGAPKEKLVWALEVLKDGTIVSGDSSGEVCFWHSSNYTLIQRIAAHEADVLCLAASSDGQTVMSGGTDRRTAIYSQAQWRTITGKIAPTKKWGKTEHNRFHEHDIKAMAGFENKSFSFVVSGGVDTTPVVTPMREFGKEYHRTIPYVPQNPQVTSAGSYVVSWGNHHVTVWHVLGKVANNELSTFGDLSDRPNYDTVAQLMLKDDENITSVSVAASGALLAVATSAETKVFQLRSKQEGNVKVKKLETHADLSKTGSRIVQFSPDGKWLLCISLKNDLRIVRLHEDPTTGIAEVVRSTIFLRRIRRQMTREDSLNGVWGRYQRTIIRAAFSSDSRILAMSDLEGYIDSFVLEGNEDDTAPQVDIAPRRRWSSRSPTGDDSSSGADSDSDSSDSDAGKNDNAKNRTTVVYGQHWTRNPSAKLLPRLSTYPILLSFRPSSPSHSTRQPHGNPAVHPTRNNPHAHAHTLPSEDSGTDRLFVVTYSHDLYEFNVLKGQLTDWSRRNPSSMLPSFFKQQLERTMGCIWDCSVAPAEDKNNESKRGSTLAPTKERQRIWLYGAGWLFMIDLKQDLPGASWTNRSYKNKKGSKSHKKLEPTKALTNGEAAIPQNDNSATAEENKRKRKMQEQLSLAELGRFKKSKRERQREEHLSGAGGKIPDDKLRGGLGARTFKTTDPEGVTREVDILTRVTKDSDEEDSDDEDGGDDDDDDHVNALTRLRRAQKHAAEHASADANQPNGTGDDDGSTEQNGDSAHSEVQVFRGGTDEQEGDEDPPCYMTNRFRPILGMVTITTEAGQKRAAVSIGKGPKTQPLEVAIIERPPWDLAMPPKFHGSKEWKDRWKAMNLVKR